MELASKRREIDMRREQRPALQAEADMAGKSKRFSNALILQMAALALLSLSGCTVGPKYARPSVATPPAYKELTPETSQALGWKTAQPADAALHGKWWEIFNDPELNSLEEQVSVSNQNVAASTAAFMSARALI